MLVESPLYSEIITTVFAGVPADHETVAVHAPLEPTWAYQLSNSGEAYPFATADIALIHV
jgi:hypothetical protein